MNIRQKVQVALLLLLTFLTFASYHESSAGTGWLQFLTVLSMVILLLVFDFAFTSQSMFVFDPDADNWRRKVVRSCFCRNTVFGWFSGFCPPLNLITLFLFLTLTYYYRLHCNHNHSLQEYRRRNSYEMIRFSSGRRKEEATSIYHQFWRF